MSNQIIKEDINLIVKLIKFIVSLFHKSTDGSLLTNYPKCQIKWTDMEKSLDELGLDCMLKSKYIPDSIVSYTDKESWAKIVPYLTLPADLYVNKDADCDDYSQWAAAESSMKFKRKCLQCWGNTPYGYHAFNMVQVAHNKYMYFEPNAGFPFAGKLFNAGEHGYIPEAWK